jgi:membrane-associated phospholipid phosphatase
VKAFRTSLLLLSLTSASLLAPVSAIAQRPEAPLVTGRDLAWLGAGTAASLALMQADSRIARSFRRGSLQESSALLSVADGYALVNEKSLFAAGVLTWAGARLVHAPAAADVALHTTEAIFVSSAVSTVIRGTLGRSRPFVTGQADAFDYHPGQGFRELKYRAFPSIHSSAAFSTAAALTAEMQERRMPSVRFVGPVLYTLAAGPGLARMYHDKHWASDVLMGAVLGTVTGVRAVRYSHGNPGNRVDRWLLDRTSAVIAPDGSGIAMAIEF